MRLSTAANRYLAEIQKLTGESAAQNVHINQMVTDVITAVARQVLDHATYIAQHAVSVLGNFLLMIVAFFFMIRDQRRRRALFSLLPFTRGHEDDICEEVVKVTRSTLLGSFLTAIAQAVGAAVGFWFSGVPVLFGAVATAFASLIPVIGYSGGLATGDCISAIHRQIRIGGILEYLVAYRGCVSSGPSARPIIMSGRTRMNTPLVFSLF